MSFQIALTNVLITIVYIIPGYLICKAKKADTEHLSTISAVLIYICTPCMLTASFFSVEFTPDHLLSMLYFFIVTFVLQAVFMLGLYLIFRKRYDDAKYRIFTIASVLGNVGYFGLPIVKALVPSSPEVTCYSSVYVLSMNILVFTVGAFCLTAKKEYMTLRTALLNPSVIGFAVALLIFVSGIKDYLPAPINDSIQLVGSMSTPLCMIILGVRLAAVSMKKVFSRPFIYLICLGKLVIFPLFCYFAVYFLPFDAAFKSAVLILSAAPCASVIQSMAEMYGSETELSANCVLLSTLMCFITIPLMTLAL